MGVTNPATDCETAQLPAQERHPYTGVPSNAIIYRRSAWPVSVKPRTYVHTKYVYVVHGLRCRGHPTEFNVPFTSTETIVGPGPGAWPGTESLARDGHLDFHTALGASHFLPWCFTSTETIAGLIRDGTGPSHSGSTITDTDAA